MTLQITQLHQSKHFITTHIILKQQTSAQVTCEGCCCCVSVLALIQTSQILFCLHFDGAHQIFSRTFSTFHLCIFKSSQHPLSDVPLCVCGSIWKMRCHQSQSSNDPTLFYNFIWKTQFPDHSNAQILHELDFDTSFLCSHLIISQVLILVCLESIILMFSFLESLITPF